jgi:hypothetical protein
MTDWKFTFTNLFQTCLHNSLLWIYFIYVFISILTVNVATYTRQAEAHEIDSRWQKCLQTATATDSKWWYHCRNDPSRRFNQWFIFCLPKDFLQQKFIGKVLLCMEGMPWHARKLVTGAMSSKDVAWVSQIPCRHKGQQHQTQRWMHSVLDSSCWSLGEAVRTVQRAGNLMWCQLQHCLNHVQYQTVLHGGCQSVWETSTNWSGWSAVS